MKFLWPGALIALALIPLLGLWFVWRQRRRRRFAVRYSSLSLVRAALPEQSRLRRYLPMALFFLALASLVVSLARPVTVTRVPAGRATVMLVLDVSGSMRMNDIAPTRLAAAQQAALEFVTKQKDTNQVGIVAFADIAQLVQAPTTAQQDLENAIYSLSTGRRTAIGEGILAALHTISDYGPNAGNQTPATPAPGENYQPDIIVLLTDGVSNAGIDPLEAAQQAADSRIRIYTIGFGTQPNPQGQNQLGRGGGLGRGGFGGRFGFDETTLKSIASMTGGKYYAASSAGELQKVFDSLPTMLIAREQTVEISVVFATLAALLVISALLLAQLWHPLP
jgi:Ca-activated chloride channel family protein